MEWSNKLPTSGWSVEIKIQSTCSGMRRSEKRVNQLVAKRFFALRIFISTRAAVENDFYKMGHYGERFMRQQIINSYAVSSLLNIELFRSK